MSRAPAKKENRLSFTERLKLKVSPADFERIMFAYELAKYGHKGQRRDSGERYFEHPRYAAIILIDELGITDPEMIIAILLHDMPEDSYLLTKKRIKLNFGKRVADMVMALTKPKRNDPRFNGDDDARHEFYFQTLKDSPVEVKILKLVDRLHNLRTISECAREKQLRKIKETREQYLMLIDDVAQTYSQLAEYLHTAFAQALKQAEEALGI